MYLARAIMPTTKRGTRVMIKPFNTHTAPVGVNTVSANLAPAAMPTEARNRQMPISRSNRLAEDDVYVTR